MFKAKSGLTVTDGPAARYSEDSVVPDDPVSISGVPTPLQFDAFVPWVCSQWCASTNVVVTRMNQEEYVKFDPRKSKVIRSKGRCKSTAPMPNDQRDSSGSVKGLDMMHENRVVQMKTVYNNKRRLVEVAISGCPFKISIRIIQAFSLCISFHSSLNRLTFRRGGLSGAIIYEINKLLPHSHITELCFDDSYVREANYYILLENLTQLKYLSLNRCRINDEICCKIIEAIDYGSPSSETLQILELSSNEITNVGAKCVGAVLKKNRCLVHLNLSGNKISDEGFKVLMDSLKKFPLTSEENIAMKGRRLRYIQNKAAVYERCFEELKNVKTEDGESTTGTGKKNIFSARRMRRKSKRFFDDNIANQAEMMTKSIVGEFKDPYCPENIVCENGYLFSKGNFSLSSLNVAYNNLEYPSVQKVRDVVAYQCVTEKVPPETGLVRITLDGNPMPSSCELLDEIDLYLRKVIIDASPSARKTRTSSLLRKLLAARGPNF